MSEAFDNVGVMMLLHQKMMRDAEVATAYQLMVANPEEEEEPPNKKKIHNWWSTHSGGPNVNSIHSDE